MFYLDSSDLKVKNRGKLKFEIIDLLFIFLLFNVLYLLYVNLFFFNRGYIFMNFFSIKIWIRNILERDIIDDLWWVRKVDIYL